MNKVGRIFLNSTCLLILQTQICSAQIPNVQEYKNGISRGGFVEIELSGKSPDTYIAPGFDGKVPARSKAGNMLLKERSIDRILFDEVPKELRGEHKRWKEPPSFNEIRGSKKSSNYAQLNKWKSRIDGIAKSYFVALCKKEFNFAKKLECQVKFTVSVDKKISDVTITRSSNNAKFDETSVSAVKALSGNQALFLPSHLKVSAIQTQLQFSNEKDGIGTQKSVQDFVKGKTNHLDGYDSETNF